MPRKANQSPAESKPPRSHDPRRAVLGRQGETLAAQHLESLGHTMVARNIHTPFGELDLVTRHGEWTICVEVKTRSNQNFGLPEQAVDGRKRAHVFAAAQYYLQQEQLLATPWRIDVVAIEVDRRGNVKRLEVFEDAIRDQ
jgi:putative endonuclease